MVAFKVKRCVVGYNNMPINVYSGALNVYSCVHFYVVQHGIHLMVKKKKQGYLVKWQLFSNVLLD